MGTGALTSAPEQLVCRREHGYVTCSLEYQKDCGRMIAPHRVSGREEQGLAGDASQLGGAFGYRLSTPWNTPGYRTASCHNWGNGP
jgi:hypothetical protein